MALPALTGLRMLAAGVVYLSHLTQPAHLNGTVSTFMSAGYNGVTLFFVLSGFVLGLNYFDRFVKPTARATWNYAVARVARIYPLYIAVLLFVVVQYGVAGTSMSGLWLHVAGLQAWSRSYFMEFGFNQPAWSVSVELFLYACFPLLVLLIARIRRTGVLLAVLALAVAAVFANAAWFIHAHRDLLPVTDSGSAHRWLYVMPVSRLGDFAAGVLLSQIYRAARHLRWTPLAGRIIGTAGAIAMIGLMCSKAHLFSAWSYDASYLLPSLAIIWGLATAGNRSWLASRPMVAAGEASYAFYLIHYQIMFKLGAGKWGAGITKWSVATQVMIFFIVLAAAIGLHRLIERPARKWLTRTASVPIRA